MSTGYISNPLATEAANCRKKRAYALKIITLVRDRDINIALLNDAMNGLKKWERDNKINIKLNYEDQFDELIEHVDTGLENMLDILLNNNINLKINKSDN